MLPGLVCRFVVSATIVWSQYIVLKFAVKLKKSKLKCPQKKQCGTCSCKITYCQLCPVLMVLQKGIFHSSSIDTDAVVVNFVSSNFLLFVSSSFLPAAPEDSVRIGWRWPLLWVSARAIHCPPNTPLLSPLWLFTQLWQHRCHSSCAALDGQVLFFIQSIRKNQRRL